MTTLSTRPETSYERELRSAAEHFEAERSEHEMKVLLDLAPDQPYRHIRFAKPGTGIWSWSLITWPGHLAITGDLQSFTFSRIHDMFDFFRGANINPGYWSEKLVAGTADTKFTEERYVERVTEAINDSAPTTPDPDAFRAAAHDELLATKPTHREEAYDLLLDFEHAGRRPFEDAYEWDLGGYDHHFLLACHAIQYGIRVYLDAFPANVTREVSRG